MLKKILLVDDDPDLIDAVAKNLEENNYRVFIAFNGKTGMKMAQQENPDLIIMDIMMTELSGGETARFLKQNEQTKHIPIIFLTTVTTDMPDGHQEKQVNVDGKLYPTIAKPFEPDVMLAAIREELIGSE